MSKTQSGVYAFRNLVTGGHYVGSSVDLATRKRVHLRTLRNGTHRSVKFLRSWQKHGEAAFEFVVLELVPREETPLRAAEQRWMDHLDVMATGYNLNPVAGNVGRMPKSAEHKQRIGDARRGQKHTAESKAVIAAKALGRVSGPASAERKLKISAANTGRVRTPEQRAALSRARTGMKVGPMSAEHRAAISAAKKARHAD